MPLPITDENHHELMDVVGSLIRPEIHEKCMHASGDVIVWIGYTDERMEGVWADAQPPYDLIPFEGNRIS